MASTKLTLLDELQLEFPSLDSSLIAAFLSEFDSATPTRRQLRTLRQTLTELATGADRDERLINEAPSGVHMDSSSLSSGAAEGNHETFSARSTLTDGTSSLASPRSTSSAASFSTPLGILQAAFPGVPSARLEYAIANASFEGGYTEDVDIGRAIQLLLAQEYMPDDGENGLSVLDNDHTPMPQREQWTVNVKGKRRRDKFKTVAINDMRLQQQNGSKSASRHDPCPITPQRSSDVDIWTSISSISIQLATLLPSRSESFFKSFFHSPESKSPAAAVRRALTAIINAGDSDGFPLDTIVLLRLQEILRSTDEYSELNAEGQKRFLSDAYLCLRAVGSRQDDALDLVLLLRNLADDAEEWTTTSYHQGPLPHGDHDSSRISKNMPSPISPPHAELLSGPLSGLPSPQPQSEWNVVSRRKRSASANHHVPPNITNDSHGTSTHQINLASDKDIERLNQRLDDLKTCLAEASVLAGKAWKGGKSKNLGRQVAMYHVEEVRRLQEEIRNTALDLERARVHATKKTTSSVTTIDLHHTTAAQAVILAKELLRDYGTSDTHPMQFITGRGKHSVGGKAVLRPAVYDALIKDGWDVSTFSAGVTVRGRLQS